MATTATKPKNAAIYCRTSDEQGRIEDSLAYQVGSAMAFIMDNDLSFQGLYVDEDGYSSLETLIRTCSAGMVDCVIVRDLDVLTTDDAALNYMESFPVVIIGAEDLDSNRENLWVETLKYKVETPHHSEEHKANIQESVRETVEKKKEAGKFTGRTPYGYQKVGDEYIADPDTSVIVKQIFDMARDGNRPAEIRNYLNQCGIPTPTGGAIWSIPYLQHLLKNESYLGATNAVALIDRETFEWVSAIPSRNKTEKLDEEKEPDLFPMAVCGVCGKKLIFNRARKVYICDRHIGSYPTESRLEVMPRISVEELKKAVTRQYNEHLIQMHYFKEEEIPFPDMGLEERNAKKIELGEMILGIPPDDPNYLADVKTISEGYEGIWTGWIRMLREMRDTFHKNLIRARLPEVWRPMYEYNPEIGTRAIELITLEKDGRVVTRFKTEDVFRGDA